MKRSPEQLQQEENNEQNIPQTTNEAVLTIFNKNMQDNRGKQALIQQMTPEALQEMSVMFANLRVRNNL